jgi:mannose-6-phosphate isomerase-like protein (cupin superfamily)
VAFCLCLVPSLHGEIHGVLKSDAIDAQLAKVRGSEIVHKRSNFAITLNARSGKGTPETHPEADQVFFIRRGNAAIWLADRKHDIGPGDVINVPRGLAYRTDVGPGRLEYVAAQIFPTGEGLPLQSGLLSQRKMSDVLTASEIASTIANNTSNQPIHSARNFTMNYVIYSGHAGPWEAHRGCVDIYFLKLGTATAQLGGQIQHVKDESPGEPRGTGVMGAEKYDIGPGDIVLIPRNTAHHMDPSAPKLSYILMKVWAE